MIDHRALLKSYIAWVIDQQGTAFIKNYRLKSPRTNFFDDEEWEELIDLFEEVIGKDEEPEP